MTSKQPFRAWSLQTEQSRRGGEDGGAEELQAQKTWAERLMNGQNL